MKKRGIYTLVAGLIAVAAVVLVLTQVIFPGSVGTDSPEASPSEMVEAQIAVNPIVTPTAEETPPAPTALMAEEAASPPGGPHEGIQVHGHWTIEVRDPDGTLVEQREFDNDLSDDGKTILMQFLSRQMTIGVWEIALWNYPNQPCEKNGNPAPCVACEASDPYVGDSNLFNTLTVTPIGSAGTSKIVLSGSVTTAYTTNIIDVITYNRKCAPTVSPADCAASGSPYINAFTLTTLSPEVPVEAGQQVLVTVEISFS